MIDTIKVNHIVATDLDGCIGKDNQLMWHIAADLRRFKSLTEGGVIVMGRKTFESLGCKPLPNRVNVVITSDYYYGLSYSTGPIFYTSISAAIARARDEASFLGLKEVWVIGGQSIYDQTMQYVDKIVKTVVYNQYDGDTFYHIPVDKFEESSRSVVYTDNQSELKYQFITYRLIKEKSVSDIEWQCEKCRHKYFKGELHCYICDPAIDYPIVGHKENNPICTHCKHDYTGHQLEVMCMDENNNCQLCRAALSGKFADGQGRKDDSNKPRYSLLPTGTVNQVVQVMEYGSVKYETNNWQLVTDARTRYYDAAMRHIDDWWNGSTTDSESGLPHLAHAICCLLFLMWFDDQE